MEPLPKQGCETSASVFVAVIARLSGTPAEAGVRVDPALEKVGLITCLSGTPAEAGVRGRLSRPKGPSGNRLSGTPTEAGVRGPEVLQTDRYCDVSVEPLPKQGCEGALGDLADTGYCRLSGTPAEAGVRVVLRHQRSGI